MVKFSPIPLPKLRELVSGEAVYGDINASSSVDALGEPLEFDSSNGGASQGGLTFLISESFAKDISQTGARVVVMQASLVDKLKSSLPSTVKVLIASPDAYVGLAEVTRHIASSDPLWDWPSQKTLVSETAVIGARTVVLPGAIVGPGVEIGEDCKIFPGVVIYPRTKIGNRVRIHANAVIGADGFGYARSPKGSVKIWHLGSVRIGDDVEIGAGTAVDRGTLKDTVIETGAKLDNLVQVGHNGFIKAHAILCAQVGMAGNVTIGRGAILAGKVGVADKLEIGDGALVGPMSGLSKDVKAGDQVMGQQPARPRREWWRLIAHFERLPDLFDRVKKIEKRFEKPNDEH